MRGYLTPKQVLDNYGRSNGGAAALKARLADDFKSGRLEVRAKLLWNTQTINFKKASKEKHKSKRNAKMKEWVSVNHWSGPTTEWILDQARWDWEGNRFYVTSSSKPLTRTFIYGLYLPISILNELLIAPKELELDTTPGRPGHPGSEHWDELWLLLVDMARAGELRREKYKTVNSLVTHLRHKLTEKMGKTTIRGKLETHFRRLINDLPKG